MAALALATTDLGSGDGPPILIVHGLFGRRRNWQAIQKQLARKHRIVAADLRNHGDSPWDDTMTYPAMADDLAALIEGLGAGPAVLVGHSMGGKASMRLALERPELLAALVVIDIAPVTYEHDFTDYIEAMQAMPLATLARRSDAEAYLVDKVPEQGVRNFLLQNLEQTDDGLVWRVNLDVIEKSMPSILGFDAPAGRTFDGRTLFVAGAASHYIKREDRPAIAALFPKAKHVSIKDAGHWVHAEKPQEIITVIESVYAAVTA